MSVTVDNGVPSLLFPFDSINVGVQENRFPATDGLIALPGVRGSLESLIFNAVLELHSQEKSLEEGINRRLRGSTNVDVSATGLQRDSFEALALPLFDQ